MSLDLRTLYPNFHAESTRHQSSSPRPTSSKGTGRRRQETKTPPSPTRKWRDHQLPHTSTRSKQLLPSTIGTATSTTGRAKSIPPLCVNARGSRPSTPDAPLVFSAPRNQSGLAHEGSCTGTAPPKLQHAGESAKDPSTATFLRAPRSLVLRGDLAREPECSRASQSNKKIPPRLARTAPALAQSLSLTSLTTSASIHELVQCDVRPRSRYARRENGPTMQPLTHRLSLSASSPALSQGSSATLSTRSGDRSAHSDDLRASPLAGALNPPSTANARVSQQSMLSWTEQDASSFFLTEIDARDAEDRWVIARALAEGSHLLYAKAEYERAVARFADALSVAQPAPTAIPLAALLHHHMGNAFFEDGQAKWALMMQKKSLELAQECGDVKMQARALKALGVLFLDRNDPSRALDCQQQALAIASEVQDQELEARVYANLGNLAAAQQQLHHAIACHERDLEMSLKLDSAVGQARAHRNLSMIHDKMDNARAEQLEHELRAARLEAGNAFETDMRRHAGDVVGNIYWQLTTPDREIAEMAASSLKEMLTTKDDEEAASPTEQYIT